MVIRFVTERASEARVRRSVLGILRSTQLCSLATVSPPGRAYIHTAYFAPSGDLEVYFLSDAKSRHARNLATNRSMAMTVFDSTQRWGGSDRGLQLFGVAEEARGSLAAAAERAYAKRFPLYLEWVKGRTERELQVARLLRTYRFYRFVPDRVKILDEGEFGGAVFVTARIVRSRRR